jgi:DNA-binding NarL/FixJ family response regulator
VIAAYVPDLMDRSRFAGVEVSFVTSPADLATTTAEVVVLDLGRPGSVEALPSLAGRRVIAFGSHVDRDLLDAARAAGCDQVLPRSQFFSRLRELLATP